MARPITHYIPEVHLLVAGRRSRLQVDSRRPTGVDAWHLTYTRAGNAVFKGQSQSVAVSAGDLTLIRPRTPLFYTDAPPADCWSWMYAIFQPYPHWTKLLDWPPAAEGIMRVNLPRGPVRRRVVRTFEELLRSAEGGGEHAGRLAMNALERILLTVDAARPARDQPDDDPRIEKVIAHIHEHLAEPLTVDRLAQVAALSPSRLAHLFAQVVGVTPMRYVDDRRMERARDLLATTALPVYLIGQEVGYAELHHFSRRFKALVGMSPSAYRAGPGAMLL